MTRNYLLLLSGPVLLNACKQQPKPLADASSETALSGFVQAGEGIEGQLLPHISVLAPNYIAVMQI